MAQFLPSGIGGRLAGGLLAGGLPAQGVHQAAVRMLAGVTVTAV